VEGKGRIRDWKSGKELWRGKGRIRDWESGKDLWRRKVEVGIVKVGKTCGGER
jgi:hypothetical protein